MLFLFPISYHMGSLHYYNFFFVFFLDSSWPLGALSDIGSKKNLQTLILKSRKKKRKKNLVKLDPIRR